MNVAIIIFSIILSGFFSSAEIAYFSLNEAKIRTLIKKKVSFATTIHKLKKNQERLLITILIGNNVVNIGASSLVAVLITDLVGSQGVGIATAIMTLIILTVGEIIPKTVATQKNIQIAQLSAMPLLIMSKILLPVILLFELLSKSVNKLLSNSRGDGDDAESEVSELARIGYKQGKIEDYEHEVIQNVFSLKDTVAIKAMTKVNDVFAIKSDLTITQAVQKIKQKHFSRVPIYKKDINEIIGFLYVRDILEIRKSKWHEIRVTEVMRNPIFVKANHKLNDVLEELIETKTHLAIVMRGKKTTGIITIEDILEEMLGDIEDETDPEDPFYN